MSRAPQLLLARALAVWVAVTATAGATTVPARSAVRLLAPPVREASFADLLVAVCALVLLVAAGRLWVVTTMTITDLLRGRVRAGRGSATRRLVLLACGAAVAAGSLAPASATEGEPGPLGGLRLPERAVAGQPVPAPPSRPGGTAGPGPSATVHVVEPGESLWSIAEASQPPGSDLDAAWRGIWALNRDVVGDDPHLILPGQRLRLPGTEEPATHHPTDEPTDPPTDQPTDLTGDDRP